MIPDILASLPTLGTRKVFGRTVWTLTPNIPEDAFGVGIDCMNHSLEIDYYHGDGNPSHFTFVNDLFGDRKEVITEVEAIARANRLEENEGEDLANAWLTHVSNGTACVVIGMPIEFVIKQALIDHWNKILASGLFEPQVSV